MPGGRLAGSKVCDAASGGFDGSGAFDRLNQMLSYLVTNFFSAFNPLWIAYEHVAMLIGLGTLAALCLSWLPFAMLLHPVLPRALGERLGRQVNPTIYTRDELARRIRDGNAFVTKLMAQPKLWLIGSEHDLGA